MSNIVYIATSLDGYIADRNGGLGWLHAIPNPDGDDFGFAAFMDRVDGLVMGRVTFETVLSFDCEWPYSKPVFVLSNTLSDVPESLNGQAEIISGSLDDILSQLDARGVRDRYIDGGKVIQSFLREDLIDEMIITQVPILLGGGARLFDSIPDHLEFEHVETKVLLNALVQSRYKRKR